MINEPLGDSRGYKEKTFPDILGNRNGMVLNIKEDEESIGMHVQQTNPYVPFSEGEKMRRGAEPEIFDNNGGTNKGSAGGVVNHNGEVGAVTYGF